MEELKHSGDSLYVYTAAYPQDTQRSRLHDRDNVHIQLFGSDTFKWKVSSTACSFSSLHPTYLDTLTHSVLQDAQEEDCIHLSLLQQTSASVMQHLQTAYTTMAFCHVPHAALPDGMHFALFMAAVFDICSELATAYAPQWKLSADMDAYVHQPHLSDVSSLAASAAAVAGEVSAAIPMHWVMDELTGQLQHHAGFQLEYAGGVNLPSVIVSAPFAVTPMHIEDACLGAVNLLVEGIGKLWFYVPEDRAADFR